ncbi:zf-HC2 domain-containing protein [Moorellaceae bacterium AZ2]
MKCRQAKKLLSPYIDNELSDAERAALEEHLNCCDACRLELEALKRISEGLKEIYQEVKAPPDFVDKVMKRIQELEEEKNSRLFQDKLPGYLSRWLKLAVAVGLAVGVGLGALQYGRYHNGGPAVWPGYSIPAAPETYVIAEKDQGAVPETQAGENEKDRATNENGDTDTVEQVPVEGEAGRVEKQEEGKRRIPAPLEEKKSGSVTAGQELREQAKTGTRLAASQEAGSQHKVFLSRSRHVRTTMLKLEVDNLPYAKEVVAVLAEKAGAGRPREMWVYQQEETILRVVLPVDSAGQFLEKVAGLGREVHLERETVDVTGEFDRKLLEYQELTGKQDSEVQALAKALERELEDLDRETLEAGREVVNVWLKLR